MTTQQIVHSSAVACVPVCVCVCVRVCVCVCACACACVCVDVDYHNAQWFVDSLLLWQLCVHVDAKQILLHS